MSHIRLWSRSSQVVLRPDRAKFKRKAKWQEVVDGVFYIRRMSRADAAGD